VKYINPFKGSAQAHVNVVSGPLELEYGGLSPSLQHGAPCIEKAHKAHGKEEKGHGEQQKKTEAFLKACDPKWIHAVNPLRINDKFFPLKRGQEGARMALGGCPRMRYFFQDQERRKF